LPDFVILANAVWDSPTGGGGHSSQQYALAMMRRGWRVSFVQKDGSVVHTPLKELNPGPGTIVMCDLPWIDHYYDTFMNLKEQGCRTIYRIIDNWHMTPRRDYSEEREIAFITAADLVFASNPLNIERFLPIRSDITLLRNGVDLELFWNWKGDPPADLLRGKPTLVFVASFWDPEWIDWRSLFHALESCPEMTLNVIGPRERIQAQSAPRNCHFLGVKRNRLLPSYLHNCDAGLLPYNRARTRYNNPLKVLEYLGCGLPVVCCPNLSIMDYPYRYFYRDPEEFVAKIRLALETPIDSAFLHRSLSQHTWESRLESLLARLAPLAVRSLT